MSANPAHNPRVGIPYRTRKEELTGKRDRYDLYQEAVRRAGGEPVEISLGMPEPELKQVARSLDAVLLPGSPADVNPAMYGSPKDPKCAEADPDRERTDFALLEHAFAEQKPVLAICYGIQSLNVHLGGTLIQDIPAAIGTGVEHDHEDGAPDALHPVRIEPGAQLERLAGVAEAVVNSSHHQSVKDPGRGLRVTARAMDGVIEAVEWTGDSNWVIGVQWHPERMPADAFAQSLFRGLVNAAAARKALART